MKTRTLLTVLALQAAITGATAQNTEAPPRAPFPDGHRRRGPATDRPSGEPTMRYSIDQAISDRAQLHTIAFDGLAFLTGDFCSDTFLPPG